MFTFKRNYFILACILFLTEVYIALYVKDNFIRPYFGDFLVVILMYCGLKSFVNISVWKAAVIVLVFSYVVEFAQYLNLINHLHLQDSALAQVIMGNSFAWFDMLAYTLGIGFTVLVEWFRSTAFISKPHG